MYYSDMIDISLYNVQVYTLEAIYNFINNYVSLYCRDAMGMQIK